MASYQDNQKMNQQGSTDQSNIPTGGDPSSSGQTSNPSQTGFNKNAGSGMGQSSQQGSQSGQSSQQSGQTPSK